jgi:alpha,alpha-trehalase
VVECREALAFPGEPHRAVVLRRIIAVTGAARIRVALNARAEFGRSKMTRRSVREGTWTASSGPLRLRWQGAGDARRR